MVLTKVLKAPVIITQPFIGSVIRKNAENKETAIYLLYLALLALIMHFNTVELLDNAFVTFMQVIVI